jgi:uncharacterized glyoxalase superfamily protein PhnB
MERPHKNWPQISSALFYEDASQAIDWLCRVFGFEVQLKVEGEGGRIEHSELVFGGGLIMVGSANRTDRPHREFCRSPKSLDGANTQSLCVYVDDADAHCEHARKQGATITMEPKTDDYGDDYWSDRSYQVRDCEGHVWWFVQRVREQGER